MIIHNIDREVERIRSENHCGPTGTIKKSPAWKITQDAQNPCATCNLIEFCDIGNDVFNNCAHQ